MAIVEKIEHGPCRIYFCDDHIRSDPDEIQKILDNIGRIAYEVMQEKMIRENKQKASV